MTAPPDMDDINVMYTSVLPVVESTHTECSCNENTLNYVRILHMDDFIVICEVGRGFVT